MDRLPMELIQKRHAYIVEYYRRAEARTGPIHPKLSIVNADLIEAFVATATRETILIVGRVEELAALAEAKGLESLVQCLRTQRVV